MVLEGNNLFKDANFITIRYEEQAERPVISPGEMVFWHLPSNGGEMNKHEDSTVTIDSANDHSCQSFYIGQVSGAGDAIFNGFTVKGYRVGNPGTITFELYDYYALGPGLGGGGVLDSATYDGNSLTTTSPGEEFKVVFADRAVKGEDSYMMVVRCASANASNYLRLRRSSFTDYYGYGLQTCEWWSTNGGASWSRPLNGDLYFIAHLEGDYCFVNLFGTMKEIPLLDVITDG